MRLILDFLEKIFHFAVFLSKHNISFKIISGESKSVTKQMVALWDETTLLTLLSKYKLKDIFNPDEFGLFYQCLLNKTYHFKGQKWSEGKNSKVRLTGMAAGSEIGENLPMSVIGKSKTPRCFKHIKKFTLEIQITKEELDAQSNI